MKAVINSDFTLSFAAHWCKATRNSSCSLMREA